MKKCTVQTKRVRRCKVHARSQEVSDRYDDGRSGYRYVPWLRMGGLWLEQIGFKIGDPIEITVRKRKLIIKKMSD
jgi:toxic protein SymE